MPKSTKGWQAFYAIAMVLSALCLMLPLTIVFGVLLVIVKLREIKA